MPGVTVEATNTATGQVRHTVTGADGLYTLPLLQPGRYDVKATLAGFKPVVQKGIDVSVGDTSRVDIKLAVGGLEESVTVSGETPLVETSHATLGITIDQQKVVELPLNGRNFTQLGTLIPGVSRAAGRPRAARPATRRRAASAPPPPASTSTACATSRTTSCSTAPATTTRSTPAS